jgi:tetratricopeptide (TPR) repeat protein
MTHVDRDELIRYRIDRSLADDPEHVADHVQACRQCALELSAVDADDLVLRDRDTWLVVDALTAPRTVRAQQASMLRSRIEREDGAARGRLTPLLTPRLRLAEARIATRAAFLHAGTVRFLCATAQQLHEKRPLSALEAATEAYHVACALGEGASTDRRLCMALAQRERANALRYLGRFGEALKALDEAEALFDQNPAADSFDLAIVNFVRSTVLVDSDRFEEAVALARKARQTFSDYGDSSRELSASIVEAWCLLGLHDTPRAARTFEELITIARRTGDAGMLARGLANAGYAYMISGELDKPEAYYVEALALYDELGLTTEVARTNWNFAMFVLLRGDLLAGCELLDASRTELAALGLANDAAKATLRWAEVRLAIGMPAGVAEACRRIVMIFDSEQMTRRARIALAHLQATLDKGTATDHIVREVREYIENLPWHPDRPFVTSHQLRAPS